jgi:hypothetical protein
MSWHCLGSEHFVDIMERSLCHLHTLPFGSRLISFHDLYISLYPLENTGQSWLRFCLFVPARVETVAVVSVDDTETDLRV